MCEKCGGEYKAKIDGSCGCQSPAISAGYDALLTRRELWLMEKAFEAACYSRLEFDDWLQGHAADGITVEMVLAKEAP